MIKTRRILAWLLCLALCLQSVPFALAQSDSGADELLLAEATATAEPAATPEPTDAPEPTDTPKPTDTPEPAATPEPTAAPSEQATVEPTDTTEGTATPEPSGTATLEPSASPDVSEGPVPSGSPLPSESPLPAVLVTELLLTAPKATLEPGETLQLSVSILPEGATDAGVLFASDDEAVLTVDEAGLVTAVAPGEASIVATAKDGGGAQARLLLTVAPKATITALFLTSDKPELAVGDTLALALRVEPEAADASEVWFTSGDEAIAVVDQRGVVTGVAPGEVVITAAYGAAATEKAVADSDGAATAEAAATDGAAADQLSAISASLTLTVLPALPFDGSGTPEEPYLLSTREHMEALASLVAAGDLRCVAASYALTDNINLSDWREPIGTAEHPFEGAFDGRGHKLRGMMMLADDASADAYGLFGATRDAMLTRIAVELGDLNVRGGSADVGMLVGRMQGGSLTESYATGNVETRLSGGATGGLVGRLSGGVVNNCFSLAGVSADQNGGVLVGVSESGAKILHSYNRTEPAVADIEQTVGQQDATLSDVYILSAEDDQALALAYMDATAKSSYDGFDFSGVWTLKEDAQYPFPVLRDNVYTGVATYGPVTPENHPMGDLPSGRSIQQDASLAATTSLPSSYDLRSKMPAARDQNPFGTCWSFSSVAALESNMIKQGLATTSVNLAELHTVYFTDRGARVSDGVFEDPLRNFNNDHSNFTASSMVYVGGNAIGSAYTYAAGMTPCAESGPTVYNYANASALDSSGLPYSYAFDNNRVHVSGVRMSSTNAAATIKQMVIDYGAIAVSYIHDDNCLSETYSYHVPANWSYSAYSGGHAVAIVGWNDNYSKSNFISGIQPSRNGAWLVRNSWGSSWGRGGYFWVSYECADFIRDGGTAFIAEAAGDYDYCYQYDGSGNFTSFESSYGGRTIYAANVFEAQGEEKLTDVGFWCTAYSSASYSVYVYKLNANAQSPVDGTLVSAPSSGKASMMGFYKAPVRMTGSLRKGDKFSVVVKLTSPGTAYFDTDVDGYYGGLSMSYYSYSKKGQSFISGDGTYWTDMNASLSDTSASAGENARIKGYTKQYAFATSITVAAERGATKLERGSTLQMSAAVAPSGAIQNAVWSVTSGTGSATIDENGLLTGVGLGTVTVTATSEAGDANGQTFSASTTIEIVPILSKSVLLFDEGGNDVAGGNMDVNVTRMPSTGYIDRTVTATTLPNGAQHSVRWELEPDENASILSHTDGEIVIRVTGVCSPKLTATATDGSGVSAWTTIHAYEGPGLLYVGGQNDMIGGNSQQLTVAVVPDVEANQAVTWTVQSGAEYASVNSAGVLSTLRVTEEQTITVRATTIDPSVYGDFSVTLHPVIGSILVNLVNENHMGSALQNGQKLYLDAETAQPLRLRVMVMPAETLDTVTVAPRYGDVVKVEQDSQSGEYIVTPIGYGSVDLLITAGDAAKTQFKLNVNVDQYVQSVSVYKSGGVYDVAVGKSIALKASAQPVTAANRAVSWSLDCSKTYATVSASGVVTVLKMPPSGVITVTATAKDPCKAKGTRVLTVIDKYVQTVTISSSSGYDVAVGKKITLKASALPATAANRAVTWSLDCSKRYATVSASGVVTVLKKPASGEITVTATAKDARKAQGTRVLTVTDAITSIGIVKLDADGNPADVVTRKTLKLDITKGETLRLGAKVAPEGASGGVNWKSSNTKYLKVTQVKNAQGNYEAVLTPVANGTVTVTATSRDGSGKSNYMKVTVFTSARALVVRGAEWNETDGVWEQALAVGKSVTLSATVSPSATSNKKLRWAFAPSAGTPHSTYATLSGGKLTAKRGSAGQTVEVIASTLDGSSLSQTFRVTIAPAAVTSISLTLDGAVVNKKTKVLDATVSGASMTFTASSNGGLGDARFQWKLSTSSYATLTINDDNTATLKPKKVGTVRLTATATDGGGYSAYVYVKIVKKATGLRVTYPAYAAYKKTVSPSVEFTPSDTTNKTIVYAFKELNDYKYASINASSGKITVKKGGRTVTVIATAQEGSAAPVEASVELLAAPITSISIRHAGAVVSGKTVSVSRISDDLVFTASSLPSSADQKLEWEVLPKVNTVVKRTDDDSSNATTLHIKGNGTVTLKAYATDGSGKSASVRVTVGNYVTRITLAPAKAVVFDSTTSLRVDFSYLPVKASAATFGWSASHGGKVTAYKDYIKVTWKSGQLIAGQTLRIACRAKTYGAYTSISIPIVQKPETLTILQNGAAVGRKLALARYGDMQLTAAALPTLTYQSFAWKSLSPDTVKVTVDDSGVATLEKLESGVATVCVSATDGSGLKAYLIVTDP